MKNDIAQWFKFFMVGITETAQSGIKTFDGIMQLQKDCDDDIQTMGSRGVNAKKVINELYQRPIFTGAKRGRTYMFERYLNLFRS